jgi:ring-1,2-phenylacetyl-CoA epoxidase subunit PaaA
MDATEIKEIKIIIVDYVVLSDKERELGFTIPDPLLKKNTETGKWDYTEPDWEEFKRVINGDGPCNKERLEVRRIAEERGRWVREALKTPSTAYVMPLA